MLVEKDTGRLQTLIIEAANLLDQGKYSEWLTSSCAPSFKYEITAHSDEIGKKMLWMSENRDSLTSLMENVKFHEQYPGKLRRHVGLLRVVSHEGTSFQTETPVVIWHTNAQGLTQLFAVARYMDDFVGAEDDRLLFASREVVLDTRRLPMGCHVAL